MNDQRPFRTILVDDEERDLAQIGDYLEDLSRLQKWIQKPVRRLLARPDASSVIGEIRDHYSEVDVVLADLYMPTPEAGGLLMLQEFADLRQSKGYGPQLVVISAKVDAERRVEDYCRRFRDWFRFVLKPAPLAPEPKQYHSEEVWAVALEYAIYDMCRTAGSAPREEGELVYAPHGKMAHEVLPSVDALAETDASVLVVGEPGVGRSLVARRIHDRSAQATKTLSEVRCTEIPDTPLGSVLFGHARGAFAGALQGKPGLFETASEGTIILRDLTDLPAVHQAKLLAVLENRSFTRLGASKPTPTNARVICTAGQDVHKAITTGDLRSDLYRWLEGGRVRVPPLHERTEDIPLLADWFLNQQRAKGICSADEFDGEAKSRLIAYSWPGNVTELRGVVFRAALRAKGEVVTAHDLGPELLAETGIPLEAFELERAKRLRDFTEEEFQRALEACKDANDTFNKVRTARALGVPLGSFVAELERRGVSLRPDTGARLDLYAEPPSSAGEGKPVATLAFTAGTVTVNGRSVPATEEWRLLEYFLNKNDWVHWTEGYLIFPGWRKRGVSDGRTLFRQKINKHSKTLREKHKVSVMFEGDRKRGAVRWRLVAPTPDTNIAEAEECYNKAEDHYKKGEESVRAEEPLFAAEAFAPAKERLLEALRIYPNHLQSHVLLAKCYHNLEPGTVSADEIAKTIRPSWEYLEARSRGLGELRRVVHHRKELELSALWSWIEDHLVYSQVHECAAYLWDLVMPALTASDPAFAELKDLLRRMGTATGEATLTELIGSFLELPCVQEVALVSEHRRGAITEMFYGESGLDFSRLKTLSEVPCETVDDFKGYLATALDGIAEGLEERDRPRTAPKLPERLRRRLRQVEGVEQEMSNNLGRKPSEDELKDELKSRLRWGVSDIEEVLELRRRPRRKRRPKPPKI